MNDAVLDDVMLQYVLGWHEAVVQRVLIGLVAAVILGLTAGYVWRKQCTVVAALIWAVIGLALLVFALIPQQVITAVVSTEYVTRVRLIGGALSVLVLLVSLESIRRTHLQERYAILWVTTAGVVLLCAVIPSMVALLRAVMGMEYAGAIVAVAFTFLVLVSFHFSISLSALRSRHVRVSQAVAILESRVRALEHRLKHAEGEDAAGPPANAPQQKDTTNDE